MKKPLSQEQRDIIFTMNTPGYKALDEALKVKEAMLIRSLRKCSTDRVEHVRGQLAMCEEIKKFLGMKLMSLDEALEVSDGVEKKLFQNML